MKTLFLLRHAKSDWADPDQRDVDRPLNARGRAAARAMGEELRRLGLAADRIACSPARRAVETLALVADGYRGRMPVVQEPRLYLAAVETLMEIIRGTDDSHASLLLVGHNPGLQVLTLLLAKDAPMRGDVSAKYPTAALAEVKFDVERWGEATPHAGRLERFLRPRDLVQRGGGSSRA